MVAECPSETVLRERLAHITRRFSQAELARRLNRPLSTVNNYLHGTRVPALLCVELVEHLGVNPAWLLAGEGEPFLADLKPEATHTRDRLLELVRVMRSVSSLRLGALAGDPDRKALREATDSLAEYERLRGELAHSFGRSLHDLLGDAGRALQAGEVTRAGGLLRAARQLAPLAGPGPDMVELEHLTALALRMGGNEAQALEGNARVFAQALSMPEALGSDFYAYAYNYARSLITSDQLARAAEICTAALALGPRTTGAAAARSLVEVAAGWVQVCQGNALPGLARMAAHAHTMEPALRRLVAEPRLLLGRLIAGVIEFEHALQAARQESHAAEMLARWALWSEKPHELDAVIELLESFRKGGATGEEQRFGVLGAARLLREACDNRPPAAHRNHAAGSAPMGFSRLQLLAQAQHRAGRERTARRLFSASCQALRALQHGVQPPVLVLGAHHRLALRLAPAGSEARGEAERFFSAALAGGCQCFAGVPHTRASAGGGPKTAASTAG